MKTSPSRIKIGSGKFCSSACSHTYLWSQDWYKEKQSQSHKGYMPSNIGSLIAFAKSDVGRKRTSLLFKGKKSPMGMLGKKHSKETKEKIRSAHFGKKKPWASLKGELNQNWIHDREKLVKSEKKHLDGQYRNWMLSVKNRDNWKCRIADVNCDGRLEAHHILDWVNYPELRYIINNGITLCHAHHPRKRAEEKRLSPFFQELINQEY